VIHWTHVAGRIHGFEEDDDSIVGNPSLCGKHRHPGKTPAPAPGLQRCRECAASLGDLVESPAP
jgi:hypothetical protein